MTLITLSLGQFWMVILGFIPSLVLKPITEMMMFVVVVFKRMWELHNAMIHDGARINVR